MQLLQNGHSRHVTQYLKMTSFSLSQLKSKLTRFPSKALAARLTVQSIMPGRQSAKSFYPKLLIAQLAGEITVIVCGFHGFWSRHGASKDETDTAQGQLFHYRMDGCVSVSEWEMCVCVRHTRIWACLQQPSPIATIENCENCAENSWTRKLDGSAHCCLYSSAFSSVGEIQQEAGV